MNRLLQLIDGKTVAVVGNGPVDKDVSAEVDACDVVIRFNHMYRYGEGTTGKKISIICQTFTSSYMRADDRHNAEVLRQKPEVFIVKRRNNYHPWCHGYYGPDIRVNDLIDHFHEWCNCTTGGEVVCYLAKYADNSTFKVFGFPSGKAWEDYIATDAKHYQQIAPLERKAVDEAIVELAKKQVVRPACGIPRRIVVPVKRNSSGRPGKNRELLMPLLKKLESLPYQISLVGDDSELLYTAEQAYPMKVLPFHTPALRAGNTEDVTKVIRDWRDATGYSGDMALVQCTSPDLTADWVELCFDEARYSSLVATAVELDFKCNAIYKADFGGVWTPFNGAFGPASEARQNLPVCCRITGAVEVFHTDALDFPSFWSYGPMQPVFVDSAKDID